MSKINDVRDALVVQDVKSSKPKVQGVFGEKIAEEWLKKEKWDYIDTNKESVFGSVLYGKGGKNPDFIAVADDIPAVIIWDAKFNETPNNTFAMRVDEIAKYRALNSHVSDGFDEDVHSIFMVLPKAEDGKSMYLVHLSQFDEEGEDCDIKGSPARRITLKEKDKYSTNNEQKIVLNDWR